MKRNTKYINMTTAPNFVKVLWPELKEYYKEYYSACKDGQMIPSPNTIKSLEYLGGACQNTDVELWRETPGDYYADSIHVTKTGGIGINCGGTVIVKPLRDWFRDGLEKSNEEEAG